MSNATVKEVLLEITGLCQSCEYKQIIFLGKRLKRVECKLVPSECVKEATINDLRKIGFAFLCESCGDCIVTNLDIKDEDDNPYLCEGCKKEE